MVYDTLKQLREAATNYADYEDWSDTVAVTHTFHRYSFSEDGTESEKPEAIIIRLAREKISGTILVHEIMHAALGLYEMDVLKPGDLAQDHLVADNEQLAFLVSDIWYETIFRVYEIGLFSDDASHS